MHPALAPKEGIWCKRGHPCTSRPLIHSCNTAAACRLISRFHREEAAYCFEQAAAADPNAALPHWGIAIAHGPDCAWHTPFSHCRHTRLLCRSSLLLWKCIAPRMLDRAPPFVVKQHRFSHRSILCFTCAAVEDCTRMCVWWMLCPTVHAMQPPELRTGRSCFHVNDQVASQGIPHTP